MRTAELNLTYIYINHASGRYRLFIYRKKTGLIPMERFGQSYTSAGRGNTIIQLQVPVFRRNSPITRSALKLSRRCQYYGWLPVAGWLAARKELPVESWFYQAAWRKYWNEPAIWRTNPGKQERFIIGWAHTWCDLQTYKTLNPKPINSSTKQNPPLQRYSFLHLL